jgi:hypothetical protein
MTLPTLLTDPFNDVLRPHQPRRGDTPLWACLPNETASAMESHLGLRTLADLRDYYPRRYTTNGPLVNPAPHHLNQPITCYVTVTSKRLKATRTGRKMLLVTGTTDDGHTPGHAPVTVTFFNGFEASKDITAGERLLISGTLTTGYSGAGYTIDKPIYEKAPLLLLQPVTATYPATKKVPAATIAAAVAHLIPTLNPEPDYLPQYLRARHHLMSLGEAHQKIHLPATQEQADAARTRLTYDEAFAMQLTLAQTRYRNAATSAYPLTKTAGGVLDEYVRSLPYSLTDGQKAAVSEILAGQSNPHPLNALLLGDVGAGKTTVAAFALLHAAHNGYTSALIAPTEVLAEQHYESFRKSLPGSLTIHLLTGSTDPEQARAIREHIKSGVPSIVIGTHALFSRRIKWPNLAVVVIDEQHRFGVAQRDTFNKLPTRPHTLNMTATPIPRSVAMTTYGDLKIIKLPGLPAGRQPIKTHVISPHTAPDQYQRMWAHIAHEAAAGHQAFIVGAKIDPGDPNPETDPNTASTTPHTVWEIAQELTRQCPTLTYSVLHGKMSSEEKQAIMDDFAANKTHVLISTTVIEVGVNVPNATVMAIMNAERFGAAQLHQLRGRVGRDGHHGYCYLITYANPETDTTSQTRLNAIASTLDGTRIAEIDLQTRGEGQIIGTRQAGHNGLKLLTLNNTPLIRKARHDATELITQDPHLHLYPALAAWLYKHPIYRGGSALART